MKKLYFLLLFVTAGLMAQVPQGFSYQAIALNASGAAVVSAPVKIRVSILEESATGTASYVETHNPTTNNVGLFTLTIGQGMATTGTFAGVNWSQNSKFLKVDIDVNNGTNYITVGSSQLLSVPYAMFAGAVAGVSNGSTGTVFTDLYAYGTFNSYNAATAIRLNPGYDGCFYGYKYLMAGSQVKFITSTTATAAYGNGGSGSLTLNSNPFTVNTNGIYYIQANNNGDGYTGGLSSIAVNVLPNFGFGAVAMTYNAGTNTLSCTVNIPNGIDDRHFYFSVGGNQYGDNLGDGSIDLGGSYIQFPSSGNYTVTLNLNSTGDGSPYTLTQQ